MHNSQMTAKLGSIIWIVLMPIIAMCQGDITPPDLSYNPYPKGVYPSLESFLNVRPLKRKISVEARDVFRPKVVIDDENIDNCFFYDQRTKKRIKNAFAISYKGSLYIHAKSINKLLSDKKDRKLKLEHKDSFFRVIDHGTFMYLEGYFIKSGGIGFAIGSGPISIGSGGPQELHRGIIFDFKKENFDIFRDCKDFNRFLSLDYKEKTFDCDKNQLPIEVVRDIMFEINYDQ